MAAAGVTGDDWVAETNAELYRAMDEHCKVIKIAFRYYVLAGATIVI